MKQELNYEIDLPTKSEWWRYFAEYRYFVDFTFRELKGGEVTNLSLPFLFCIRHTLEIGYKMNLIELQKVSDLHSEISYKGKPAHRIDDLHKEFELQMAAIIKKYNVKTDDVREYKLLSSDLAKFKSLLHKLDEFSFSFRYPVRNDGKTVNFAREVNHTKNASINFQSLKELYDRSMLLLTYTTDVVATYIGK